MERVQVARREKVEQLVDKVVAAVEHREARPQVEVLRALAKPVGGGGDGHRLGPNGGREPWTLDAGRWVDGQQRRCGRPPGLAERLVRLAGVDQPGRCRRELVRWSVAEGLGSSRTALEAQLGEVDIIHRGDAFLGTAESRLAGCAAVNLAAWCLGVARPDELVHHDRGAAGGTT